MCQPPRSVTRLLHVLLVFGLASACTQPTDAERSRVAPASPLATEQAETGPATPTPPAVDPAVRTPESPALQTATPAVGPNGTDLSRLSPQVRDCLSENALNVGRGRTFYEAARVRGEFGTFVYVQIGPARPGSSDEFKPSILLIGKDECQSLLDVDNVFYTPEEAVPEETLERLNEQTLDWLIGWYGGPRAYEAAQIHLAGDQFVECDVSSVSINESGYVSDARGGCVSPEGARLLRDRGVRVPTR